MTDEDEPERPITTDGGSPAPQSAEAAEIPDGAPVASDSSPDVPSLATPSPETDADRSPSSENPY